MYYFVQKDGDNQRVEGTEENRIRLLEQRASGSFRKVLVKIDIPDLGRFDSDKELVSEIMTGFRVLNPYYEATRNN